MYVCILHFFNFINTLFYEIVKYNILTRILILILLDYNMNHEEIRS